MLPDRLRSREMTDSQLLKKDLFGEVRRITTASGDVRIARDTASAAPWVRWLARRLLRREARVLAALEGIDNLPQLIELHRDGLARSFIDGQPMQRARPTDPRYFGAAMKLLFRLHQAGVVHNDLAKEPNVLVTSTGEPAFIDFQLAGFSRRRGRLVRLLAREDIRHLLKHKRTYCPDRLTARERQILAKPSVASRIYMRTLKPVYLFVTRRVLGWADREGAGDRGERHRSAGQ